MTLIKLFSAFLKIGLFAIGGAYSFLPLLEKEIIEHYQWLSKEEFLNVLGISRVFPGAISIKYATYTGYKIAGIPGVIFANLGNLLVPIVSIILAFILYAKYGNMPNIKGAFNLIQLVVFSMIIAIAFQLINVNQLILPKNLLIIIISFVLFIQTKIHPALIIITAGFIGAFLK